MSTPIQFIRYRKSSGAILERGACAKRDMPKDLEDIGVMEGTADPSHQMVVDGKLVSIPQEIIDRRLVQPSRWHVWDWDLKDWIDTRSESEQAALAATKYKRDRAMEYPSIGDQLDAIWKGGDEVANMRAMIQSVKAKYPKPREQQ